MKKDNTPFHTKNSPVHKAGLKFIKIIDKCVERFGYYTYLFCQECNNGKYYYKVMVYSQSSESGIPTYWGRITHEYFPATNEYSCTSVKGYIDLAGKRLPMGLGIGLMQSFPNGCFKSLFKMAGQVREYKINQTLKWRVENPKFDRSGMPVRRKRIHGPSIEGILRQFILDAQNGYQVTKK